jgi:hypothetical protein
MSKRKDASKAAGASLPGQAYDRKSLLEAPIDADERLKARTDLAVVWNHPGHRLRTQGTRPSL